MTIYIILDILIPLDIIQSNKQYIIPETHLAASNRIKQKYTKYINIDKVTWLANSTVKQIKLKALYTKFKISIPSNNIKDLVEKPAIVEKGKAGTKELATTGKDKIAADLAKQSGSSNNLPNQF